MLDSRRGFHVAIGAGGAAALALGGLALATWLDRPQVTAVRPAAGAAVPSGRAPIVVRIANGGALAGLRVTLDGRDVTRRVRIGAGRLVVVPRRRLTDGRHSVSVRFSSDNPFARSVSRRWTFRVDTRVPSLAVSGPSARVSPRRTVTLRGTAEPGATVRASWPGGSAAVVAPASGRWRLTGRLREGPSRLRIVARDAAGNERVLTRRIDVDTVPPRLVVDRPAPGPLRSTTLTVTGRILGESPRGLLFGGSVQGRPIADAAGRSAAPVNTVGPAAPTDAAELRVAGHRFRLTVPSLAQGRNRVTVWARDPAGNRTTRRLSVLVDSVDRFGESVLLPGARGEDVVTLQRRLKQAGLYRRGAVNGRYDGRTQRAVRGYQHRFHLRVTGEVDQATLRALVGRLVVSLGQRKLRLIRSGRVVETFRVAVGQSAYPTPLGSYRVVMMERDPTWFPPSSPWAKGLGPIPPGVDNPLGTRWIGTSAPGIGIHGTPEAWSIGGAASHGCIRMRIPDVERLYDDVSVGMPVRFVG